MSIFDKAGVGTTVRDLPIKGATPGHAPAFVGVIEPLRPSAFPATLRQNTLPARQLIVSDDDIDRIGENVSRDLGNTTQKIITKMSVGKFDELGAILTVIAAEADKLDPASLQKGGVVGWFQNKFSDLKATLTMRLVSAQEVFGDLENKISMNITVQQQWITDMEGLYGENYNHYGKIVAEMREVEGLISNCESQVAAWPAIDMDSPNAAMEAQMVRDAESKIHRLKLKLDTLLRLKTMTEINSPRIRQQQESSRTAVSTLKGIMMNIPVIMMEFALFKQTLDVNSSIQLVSNVRDLTEKSLLQGSAGAKLAAISSAKALGTATISTETLSTLRNRVLETVTEVRQIERDDVVRCTNDAKQLVDGQKTLLTALQQTGSI
jgi:uncharacterized protein YaaN involved in tellurite resistance